MKMAKTHKREKIVQLMKYLWREGEHLLSSRPQKCPEKVRVSQKFRHKTHTKRKKNKIVK
jgi:hypothetical protein